jgi:hypothetical protein
MNNVIVTIVFFLTTENIVIGGIESRSVLSIRVIVVISKQVNGDDRIRT